MFPSRVSPDFSLDLLVRLHEVILADWGFFPVLGLDFDPVKVRVLGETWVDLDGFGLFAVLCLVENG